MSECYKPAPPTRHARDWRGPFYRPHQSVIVWLPDSVVAELSGGVVAGVDRIRPYYKYGNELFELSFKSVCYPAIDPDPAGRAKDLSVLYY
jgi:hypothetical protein